MFVLIYTVVSFSLFQDSRPVNFIKHYSSMAECREGERRLEAANADPKNKIGVIDHFCAEIK